MTYQAVVCRINTLTPIPGADRIQLANVLGYQVIVGKEVEINALGVMFADGGQLSEEFCQANDLIRRKNPDGTIAGGMFEEHRRVRAMKMRGVKSEGFWVPVHYFNYIISDIAWWIEGTTFTEINGHPICQRYETPATRQQMQQNKTTQRRGELPTFRKQFDISQFRHEHHLIPLDAVLYITEKLHGTSHRIGYAYDRVEVPTPWYKRILGKTNPPKREWRVLHGSKNVVLEHEGRPGYYGSDTFRYAATAHIEPMLRKGETVYGEIVGWYGAAPHTIMPVQSTKELKDVADIFGPTITYSYGCEPGTCTFYVYRITFTNEDGYVEELPFYRMQARAEELGLKTVPLIVPPTTRTILGLMDDRDFSAFIDAQVNGWTGVALPSVIDPRHLAEGIVVRSEHKSGTLWLKHKAWTFGVLDGYLRNDPTVVDMEEVA